MLLGHLTGSADPVLGFSEKTKLRPKVQVELSRAKLVRRTILLFHLLKRKARRKGGRKQNYLRRGRCFIRYVNIMISYIQRGRGNASIRIPPLNLAFTFLKLV